MALRAEWLAPHGLSPRLLKPGDDGASFSASGATMIAMATAPLSSDDALLERLQAPPDLREGADALEYWRGRRRRLPWYRVAARREAARMTVVWERRVRGALLRQRGSPTAVRLQAAGVARAFGPRRWGRRFARGVGLRGAVLLRPPPAILVLDLLLHAF